MIPPLPFALRIPKKDTWSLGQFTSTTYRFQGRMRLGEAGLAIEWSGTAKVEEVGVGGVNEETVTLPHESVDLPLDTIARARLRGGWWLPRIEITCGDLESLRTVPSEDGGRVSFWIARSDRGRGQELVTMIDRQ
jgi:hypothetical protein